jgi:FkbM family methyltransferase
MKKITKSSLYEFTQQILPPFIFSSLKKTGLYSAGRSFARQHLSGEYSPSWHAISDGPLKGLFLYMDSKDPWQKDMLNGNYDDFFYSYVDKIDLNGKIVFDIGAHIGFSSLYFAKKVGTKGQVIAFEPNPFNRERMEKILEKNKLNERVSISPLALTDTEGATEFVFSHDVDNGTSSGSFVANAHTFLQKENYEKQSGFERMTVKTSSLDHIVIEAKTYPAPHLIKLDIEGAEDLALEGGMAMIRQYRPTILAEIHSIYTMYKVHEFMLAVAYKTVLLAVEPDGRCFIACEPSK